jgi:hypothetical protein
VDVGGFARGLARAHPTAKLPCPVCVVTVKAENLDKHLDKVHAGIEHAAASEWHGKAFWGLVPCALSLDGEALVLRRFGKRRLPLDAVIEIGALLGSRPQAGTSSYADDMNVPYETVRTGSYMRLSSGKTSITIGSAHGTQFAEHWMRGMWKQGPKRRRCDIRVPREALAAIEYVLARSGTLVPATV